jgi:methionyl aminopeptidase
MGIEIKSAGDLAAMRLVGRLAAETLQVAGESIRAGMSTDELDAIVHEDTLRRGARPSQLGYHGFPKSVCVSRNHVVCHGIPGPERLCEGDIVNIDVTSYFGGFHGDCSATFFVGTPSPAALELTQTANRCLDLGIAAVREGARLGDIGAAIQAHAEAQGYSVVRDCYGHGIGRQFHTEPDVSHVGTRGTGVPLRAGMVFTIEPMINLGRPEVETLADGWTVVTRDRSLSAQFEHTIAVTRTGCEILTARPASVAPRQGGANPSSR